MQSSIKCLVRFWTSSIIRDYSHRCSQALVMQVQKWTLLICNIYRRHCIYIVFDFHVKVLFQFLELFNFDFSSGSMFHVRGTVKTYAQYRIFDNTRFINSFTNELTESFGMLGRLFSHWRERMLRQEYKLWATINFMN